jgi:hypothetical protein
MNVLRVMLRKARGVVGVVEMLTRCDYITTVSLVRRLLDCV